jgi:SET family sugar efflux transporter-like MFS transporter
MGAAAGLEITIMIGAGIFAGRWRLFSPLKLAAVCGLLFYLGVYWSESLVPLVLLQIFNGAFIGVMAGLGISVFQALMQGRMGMASTLYSNAIKVGSLVGALLGGAVAQWLSIQAVFGVCALMALVALLALVKASAGNRS